MGDRLLLSLLTFPGKQPALSHAIDGYQMARQGRAGPALGIAALGSFIAGTLAVMGLAISWPSSC